MNFLEKLLDGAAVEWKTLGGVCDLITTGKLNANAMEDDGVYPFFTCNETPYKINSYAFDLEAILISGNGSQVGHLNYHNGKFNAYQRTYIVSGFKDSIEVMYLFHYLNHTLKGYITQHSKKGSVPYITMPMLDNFKIPIPCPDNPEKSLAIQAEIVRILDTLTELTAELTAELTDRKKQYNYYRDRLLTFEEGEAEWKTLGEIGAILRGTAITEKEANLGDYPVVANGPSHNYFHDQSNRSGETIVIARSGVYAGLVSYWDIPIFLTDAFSIHPDNNALSTKFLYYVLKKDQIKIHNMSKGAGVPHVRAKDFESYKVPVPPLEEQARIVAILDKFDAITTSIREGLPREIALRQKQYEYYRDLLLTFPKPEEVEAHLNSMEKSHG